MSIKTVAMYTVVCDHEDCGVSAQEGGDFAAWAEASSAVEEAQDGDWYMHEDAHLCPRHSPTCAADGCSIQLRDAEFGAYCEDHEEHA